MYKTLKKMSAFFERVFNGKYKKSKNRCNKSKKSRKLRKSKKMKGG